MGNKTWTCLIDSVAYWLELYASLGRLDTGPRQCVFVVMLVSSGSYGVQVTRLCARVKESTAPRCRIGELPLDKLELRRITVRDMPQRTQIRITYQQPFTLMRVHRTDYEGPPVVRQWTVESCTAGTGCFFPLIGQVHAY